MSKERVRINHRINLELLSGIDDKDKLIKQELIHKFSDAIVTEDIINVDVTSDEFYQEVSIDAIIINTKELDLFVKKYLKEMYNINL